MSDRDPSQPGVDGDGEEPSAEDMSDKVDEQSEESFPASDPPATY